MKYMYIHSEKLAGSPLLVFNKKQGSRGECRNLLCGGLHMQSGKPKDGKKREQTLYQLLELIEKTIRSIQFGSITLIIQDGYIIQLEKNEKIRIDSVNLAKYVQDTKNDVGSANPNVGSRILAAVQGLQYGQVVILIKDGNVIQVDRTDKQRIANWQGTYGDGI